LATRRTIPFERDIGRSAWLVLACLLCIGPLTGAASGDAVSASEAAAERPRVSAGEVIYREVDELELRLHVFTRDGAQADDPRPAVVLYHGGGWAAGRPRVLFAHARRLAEEGYVAAVVEYRLLRLTRGVGLDDIVADCRAAWRYVRDHADAMGVDPDRIAVLGDSAGGHLAACVGLGLPGDGDAAEARGSMDDGDETAALPLRPAAMVLFNPILDLDSPWGRLIGDRGMSLSPQHAAVAAVAAVKRRKAGDAASVATRPAPAPAPPPPTLLMHGDADSIVSVDQSRRFAATMELAGARIEYVELEGTGHAFAIPGFGKPEQTRRAFEAMVGFLDRTLVEDAAATGSATTGSPARSE